MGIEQGSGYKVLLPGGQDPVSRMIIDHWSKHGSAPEEERSFLPVCTWVRRLRVLEGPCDSVHQTFGCIGLVDTGEDSSCPELV